MKKKFYRFVSFVLCFLFLLSIPVLANERNTFNKKKPIQKQPIKIEEQETVDIFDGLIQEIVPVAPHIKMIAGTSQRLHYQIVPENAYNQKVTFATSDKNVVSVDSKGIMKGIKTGRAVITVASTDGSGKKTRILVDITEKVSKVKNIAHRGLVLEAPENTMAAFEAAGEKGFWGVEFDIQSTKDHHFIVMHDADLARMTNGTGYIKDYKRWELWKYRIDSGENIDKLPVQRIPELSDVLKLCKAYGMAPVIELKEVKPSELPHLLEVIRQYDMEDKAVVISFKLELLEWLRNHSDILKIQWIERKMSTSHIKECSMRNIDIDTKFYGLTKQKVDMAHNDNVYVNCWTILNEADYRKVHAMGVDYITMDMVPPKLK